MAALRSHHLDQFAARHQGVRYSLETGKLPRLDPAALRRLAGVSPEQIRARRHHQVVTYIGVAAFLTIAASITVAIQAVL